MFGNRWWGPAELDHAVTLTRPVLAFTDHPEWGRGDLRIRQIDVLSEAFTGGLGRAAATGGDEDTPALILFTSGSAGCRRRWCCRAAR